jgi:aspartate 1-decarboxylase
LTYTTARAPSSPNAQRFSKTRPPQKKIFQGLGKSFRMPRVQHTMLKSKIHRATLTGVEPDYEGSITLDRALMQRAGILPFEQVHVLNLNNAARLVTYAIEAPAGTGTVMLNGPAARLGLPGDLVVILTYAQVSDAELASHKPTVILVDAKNRPRRRPHSL